MFDAIGEALDGWQILLDAFEGYVSRAKAMGWTDEQARTMVLPQLVQMLRQQQPQQPPD